MKLNGIFKKPKNELEHQGRKPKAIGGVKKRPQEKEPPGRFQKTPEISEENRQGQEPQKEKPREAVRVCPACKKEIPLSVLSRSYYVCGCGHHFRVGPRTRIRMLADRDSFQELFSQLESENILEFEGYEEKLEQARAASGEKEGVVCGTAEINGKKCALFVMNSFFMMGSMGTVVGEKITRLFEYALEHRLPVVGFTVSGGARMQEGILSLMQMAKTSGAVKRHSQAGLFYLTVLTDPTTGGVTASFAMEGDIIMAEPGATVGFAGARVIEQTIRKKLPEGFQKAEFLLEHGFVDLITPRAYQRRVIALLLAMHSGQMVFASDEVEQRRSYEIDLAREARPERERNGEKEPGNFSCGSDENEDEENRKGMDTNQEEGAVI